VALPPRGFQIKGESYLVTDLEGGAVFGREVGGNVCGECRRGDPEKEPYLEQGSGSAAAVTPRGTAVAATAAPRVVPQPARWSSSR
jgi:hypothetical protein